MVVSRLTRKEWRSFFQTDPVQSVLMVANRSLKHYVSTFDPPSERLWQKNIVKMCLHCYRFIYEDCQ